MFLGAKRRDSKSFSFYF